MPVMFRRRRKWDNLAREIETLHTYSEDVALYGITMRSLYGNVMRDFCVLQICHRPDPDTAMIMYQSVDCKGALGCL